MPPSLSPQLHTPAEAAAWRRSLSPTPEAVTIVTGTFEILHPGNLSALREAALLPGKLAVVADADGAAPSQAARGGAVYPLADRLACLQFLKPVAAVLPGRPNEADALFHALSPFAWVGCPFADDGPVAGAAIRLAARRIEIPLLPGFRTAQIGEAVRNDRTPLALPAGFLPPPVAARDRPAATVNGCFDVLHLGHYHFLAAASELAGPLTLLINSDESIRRYKGASRPIFPFPFRRAALLAMKAVAEVYAFEEDEPLTLLARLKPPLHIKGGSREPDRVRREEELLRQWGGRVEFCPLLEGYSTTGYLGRIGA
ncbi:MAG: adenylyltransferase/cytidyltransferase family protein [Kiritimatiellia bacterium]